MDAIYELGVVVSAVDQLSGPTNEMLRSVGALDRSLGEMRGIHRFGRSLRNAGLAVTAIVGILAGSGVAMAQPLLQVEEAAASLQTVITPVMGSMQADMAAVRGAAEDWSSVHTDGAAEFVRTSYNMVSAGLDTRQAIEGTRTAMTVAAATMGDSADAASLLATIYKNLGDQSVDVAGEMARLGDQVTRTQQMFKIADLSQLQAGLQYAIPAALSARSSLEDLLVVVGRLNTAGLEGSMAGTAYSNALGKLLTASTKLGFAVARNAEGGIDFIGSLENIREALGPVADWSDTVQIKMREAFGEEGIRAISTLVDQTGDLRAGLEAVAGATGAAKDAQSVMESTPTAQWEMLKNTLGLVSMEFAKGLLPILQELLPIVRSVAQGLRDFLQAHPGIARVVAVVLGLVVAVGSVVGPVLTLVGMMVMASAVMGPLVGVIGLVVAGLALLGVGVALAIAYWDEIVAATKRAWSVVQKVVVESLDAVGEALTDALNVVIDIWNDIADALGVPLELGHLAWDGVRDALEDAWRWVVGFADRFFAAGAALIDSLVEGVKESFAELWRTFENGMRETVRIAVDLLPLPDELKAKVFTGLVGGDQPSVAPIQAAERPASLLEGGRPELAGLGDSMRGLTGALERAGSQKTFQVGDVYVQAADAREAADFAAMLERAAEVL